MNFLSIQLSSFGLFLFSAFIVTLKGLFKERPVWPVEVTENLISRLDDSSVKVLKSFLRFYLNYVFSKYIWTNLGTRGKLTGN